MNIKIITKIKGFSFWGGPASPGLYFISKRGPSFMTQKRLRTTVITQNKVKGGSDKAAVHMGAHWGGKRGTCPPPCKIKTHKKLFLLSFDARLCSYEARLETWFQFVPLPWKLIYGRLWLCLLLDSLIAIASSNPGAGGFAFRWEDHYGTTPSPTT